MLPPERPQKGSTQLLQNRSPVFSLFLFSCPSLALLCLLILLLPLMSGNVHPNPGPIFPCSVCAGNVTWRGKSVQCCTCSKWAHLRCSQLFLSKFRALSSSWTSIAIISSGNQEVLSTAAGRKYSIGSSLLTSSPSVTLSIPICDNARGSLVFIENNANWVYIYAWYVFMLLRIIF